MHTDAAMLMAMAVLELAYKSSTMDVLFSVLRSLTTWEDDSVFKLFGLPGGCVFLSNLVHFEAVKALKF